jgi:hypothetical protein
MHHSQHFCHFLNASWKFCSVRGFSITCDSASQLGQNGGLSVLSSNGETEKKEGGWGMTVMFLVKDSLVKKEV